MYELSCPSCTSASYYDLREYLLMCPYCSTTFLLNKETNRKELYNDHYIIPNHVDGASIKNSVYEWLKRVHHRPHNVEKEFFVTNIRGISLPFWVVSVEVHSVWKGIIERKRKRLEAYSGAEFLHESGTFRKSYRWAVCARSNICEYWGMIRLHEPAEPVSVDWDGFPLDSTFSRGRLKVDDSAKEEKPAYDRREYFEFKYSNGLTILGIQITEEEALRRARDHVEQFHRELAKENCDYLLDIRSEVDVAGVQLIHLPFWFTKYIYRPKSFLRYFVPQTEKHLVFDGISAGVLKAEVSMRNRDKVYINAIIAGFAALIFYILGAAWHPAFFFLALFFIIVASVSIYVSIIKKGGFDIEQEVRKTNAARV